METGKCAANELSKGKQRKINRKLQKLKHVVQRETGISCTFEPMKNIAICNIGLVNGVSEEILYNKFSRYGTIQNIVLIPEKSCCFLSFHDLNSSIEAYKNCNGQVSLLNDNNIIYLLYCENMPSVKSNIIYNEYPPGLILLHNFISPEEELQFIKLCNFNNNSSHSNDQMKHRKVKHYGYEFLYTINNVDKNSPLPQKIPHELDILYERLHEKNVLNHKFIPDQLTVNHYSPGQGIPNHVDTHSAFEDPILSLSLQSDIVMEFRKNEKQICLLLPRRSLCIMSGESRYDWTHGITPRKFDIIKTSKGFTSLQRGTRISFTFRKILQGDKCLCNYKSKCDSYMEKCKLEENMAQKLEKMHVLDVYEKISTHFSETRHKPWPKVQNFVDSFDKGSILIDIGCGNGKYMSKSNGIFKLGCDTSFGLLEVCLEKKYEVLAANCLNAPLKDSSVDGAICIAVIHHLATEERRLKAVEEIVRILKVNGRALIYVWSKNQSNNDRKSNYLKDNCKTPSIVSNETEILGLKLPVHTNRTEFQHNDVMVPWKTKDEVKNTYLRFYHVFEENELKLLCEQIKGVKVIDNYYDQGNWCVVLTKLLP